MKVRLAHKLEFRPLDDQEISGIHRRQQDCHQDIADMFDFTPHWKKLTLTQFKEKITEDLKKPHTTIFAIYSGEEFVGIGTWSASWDTWSPYAWLIIWPEFRRKGIGRAVASMLLDKTFLENPGHSLDTATSERNEVTIKFLKNLGFRATGRMRRTHMIEGKYLDTVFFDILKSEYLKGRRSRL